MVAHRASGPLTANLPVQTERGTADRGNASDGSESENDGMEGQLHMLSCSSGFGWDAVWCASSTPTCLGDSCLVRGEFFPKELSRHLYLVGV